MRVKCSFLMAQRWNLMEVKQHPILLHVWKEPSRKLCDCQHDVHIVVQLARSDRGHLRFSNHCPDLSSMWIVCYSVGKLP